MFYVFSSRGFYLTGGAAASRADDVQLRTVLEMNA
jgi:hypothetical protein